jgi:hypothetical protein
VRVLTVVLLVGIHGRSTEMEAVVAGGRGGAGGGLAAPVRCGCWAKGEQRPEKKTKANTMWRGFGDFGDFGGRLVSRSSRAASPPSRASSLLFRFIFGASQAWLGSARFHPYMEKVGNWLGSYIRPHTKKVWMGINVPQLCNKDNNLLWTN